MKNRETSSRGDARQQSYVSPAVAGKGVGMDAVKLQWLKRLINDNNLHKFYASSEWQSLAEMARRVQHNECQRCKAAGYYAPCEIVHHKKYVRQHPELALSIDNLECLCRSCHEQEHNKQQPINQERW